MDAVILRMIEDDKNRQEKKQQMMAQQHKAEEEYVSKVMQPDLVPQKQRTHEQFMED